MGQFDELAGVPSRLEFEENMRRKAAVAAVMREAKELHLEDVSVSVSGDRSPEGSNGETWRQGVDDAGQRKGEAGKGEVSLLVDVSGIGITGSPALESGSGVRMLSERLGGSVEKGKGRRRARARARARVRARARC